MFLEAFHDSPEARDMRKYFKNTYLQAFMAVPRLEIQENHLKT